MNCEQCQAIETQFDHEVAASKVRKYHQSGPQKESKILIDALIELGVEGYALLDVGGGFGVLEYELLKAGLSSATNVESSSAYLEEARSEAIRQAVLDRISLIHGNFVSVKHQISPADIVTLDKVICCYDDMVSLVSASVEKTTKLYGLIYPRDTWWVKVSIMVENLIRKIKGSNFRVIVHPASEIDRIVKDNGLKLAFCRNLIDWQIVIYTRETA